MHISAWKDRLAAHRCDGPLAALYGAADTARDRYMRLCEGFLQDFGDAPDAVLLSAPGRTELAGNHTDHQLGIVLCAAVTLDIAAAAAPAPDGAAEIVSDGFGRVRVSLGELAPQASETGTTAALIRGVAAGFAARGLKIGGFRARVHSLVPAGGGLSSSAAFENLVGAILSALYHGGAVDALTLARISQSAERNYFGKPSGLMDQAASAFGGITKIDFADPEHPDVTRLAFDFAAHGYVLCAVNTHTRHDDLTADYAAIPRDMTAVANALGQPVLRRVDPAAFSAPGVCERLAREVSPLAVRRAGHFFAENERVERMAAALQAGDMKEYIKQMNASGASSRSELQNIVPAQHPERTEMAEALDRAAALLMSGGAWRIHGGGFAGCIQCLVPEDRFEAFRAAMDGFYGGGACFALRVRPFGAYALSETEDENV